MRYSKYKFKFYLNASHSIYINGVLGQEHPHTWEIVLDTVKGMDVFIQFHQVEKEIEHFLGKFQGVYMNDTEAFRILNPTLENICEYLNEQLKDLLYRMGWVLTAIEISETPARSYMIDSIDEMDEYVEKFETEELKDEIERLADQKADNLLMKNE